MEVLAIRVVRLERGMVGLHRAGSCGRSGLVNDWHKSFRFERSVRPWFTAINVFAFQWQAWNVVLFIMSASFFWSKVLSNVSLMRSHLVVGEQELRGWEIVRPPFVRGNVRICLSMTGISFSI